MEGRKSVVFRCNALQHVYQRASDHGVLFYTIEDRLVYYTLAASHAKRHNVTVFAAAIMFTHIHQAVRASSPDALSAYLRDTDSSFSRLYNFHYSRTGRLFEKPPGKSQKVSSKEQRSILIYIANNHVEKRLCSEATKERWSFLAYAGSNHPFSREIDYKTISKRLKKAVRLVDRRCAKMKGLEYRDLEMILPFLDHVEYEQFLDYVISKYSWIEFDKGERMFGGLSPMIMAVNSTTGGEYELKEEYDHFSDLAYVEMCEYMRNAGRIKDIFSMSLSEKTDCMIEIMKVTSASPYQVQKFFHKKMLEVRWY